MAKIKQELSPKIVDRALLFYLNYRAELNLKDKDPKVKWKGEIVGNKFEGTVDVEYNEL